jgi:hypothetical protein
MMMSEPNERGSRERYPETGARPPREPLLPDLGVSLWLGFGVSWQRGRRKRITYAWAITSILAWTGFLLILMKFIIAMLDSSGDPLSLSLQSIFAWYVLRPVGVASYRKWDSYVDD